MEFAEFAARADEIESETGDLAVTDLLCDLLADAGGEMPIVARFVQGRVFPAWESRTLDVGPSLCHEAIARAAGPNVSAADVEERLASIGEIGAVAASYDFGGQRGLASFGDGEDEALSVAEVHDTLSELAAAAGPGSQDRKRDLLFGLFNRADSLEARYLARLVLSEMRLGVGSGTVRDAIAEAFDVSVAAVERALQVSNDHGRVAAIARDGGEEGLAAVSLEVGRPVQAMLAQTGTVADALATWEAAAVEVKYDGARVQVHHGDATRIFSRNLEEVTDALPEVVEFVETHLSRPAILDGEVVAVGDDGRPLPFQEVLRRFRRKHEVDRMREEVSVELRAFDCLHSGGRDLLDTPLTDRHAALSDLLSGTDGVVADLTVSDDPDEIAAIERSALEAGHEGVMLKDPDSAYTPGKRGQNWLKRKPDVETLDLVVTGAEWGEGRRAELLGTFLLSARTGDAVDPVADPDEGLATIGKVATGITDERLAELTDLLEPEIVSERGTEVEIRPSVVFEVGYEEIQRSPTYSSGYALRFPRFVSVREDKDPGDADSIARVERLADAQ